MPWNRLRRISATSSSLVCTNTAHYRRMVMRFCFLLLAVPVMAQAPLPERNPGLPPGVAPTGATAEDVLAEVNALRAQRGMRPYILDTGLTEGALRCAITRAQQHQAGHTSNDFAYLPPGVRASAGGCAAWPVGQGWGSCCIWENATYAGAAYCIGTDGKRYMHLFVR